MIAVTEDELHPRLVFTGDLEWVCGFGQGHRESDPVPMPVRAKSPEDPKQMQRKRTGPKALARRKLAWLVAVVCDRMPTGPSGSYPVGQGVNGIRLSTRDGVREEVRVEPAGRRAPSTSGQRMDTLT